MRPFEYLAERDPNEAVKAGTEDGSAFVAGGTDLLQLMQEGITAPSRLVDIGSIGRTAVAVDLDGYRIGALTLLADLADDPRIKEAFPVIAEAVSATASAQVRNMATVGGNLLQRTRCLYFRDAASPCNKRHPGSGCPARDGRNRINAILGVSDQCIAAHPSDLAVALVACDAELIVLGLDGERSVRLEDFYLPPGSSPQNENVLEPGELIMDVWLPIAAAGRRSHYFKVRDRGSFEWALASCAAAIASDGRQILDARIAVGGVATKPWRLRTVEEMLVDHPFEPEIIRTAAARAADGASPRSGNAFKVPMLNAAVQRTLEQLRESWR